MSKYFALSVTVIALLAVQSQCQMAKPVFGPELAKLSFLTGHFSTQTKVYMDPNSGEPIVGSGTSTLRWGLDSMFVFLDATENNPGLGQYKGFGILGYESRSGKYVLTMYNNFGDRPEYTGVFSGDTLTMSSNISTPEGPFVQSLKWFKEGNNVRLQVFNDMGQGSMLSIDQIATPLSDK